jgi:hypothetical protein
MKGPRLGPPRVIPRSHPFHPQVVCQLSAFIIIDTWASCSPRMLAAHLISQDLTLEALGSLIFLHIPTGLHLYHPTPSMSSRSETPNSTSATEQLPPAHRKRKRKQVARACESCRVHRLKCDDHFPCGNCTRRGARCNNHAAPKLSTLPQAHREIESLRQQVEALELELEATKYAAQSDQPIHTTATRTSHHSDNSNLGGTSFEDVASIGSKTVRHQHGIYVQTARSSQMTWFGSSSLFYFIGCISTSLSRSYRVSHAIAQMLPDSASKRMYAPVESSKEADGAYSSTNMVPKSSLDESLTTRLSATQEEYFLDFFWQTYHVVYPILNETEFKDHYHSLWTSGVSERRPSPLVEIVLALCLQYGMSMSCNAIGDSRTTGLDCEDATIAGRWYYQRCQALLATESETPNISTLQCHILCSIYLCCGSFINMADSACGLAVRTAYMLGLHLDPPASVQEPERELRRRLWWTLYVLESKMSMKLGRPFLLHGSNSTCALPADQFEDVAMTGSSFTRLGEDATWLTFTKHNIRLLLIARAAHIALFVDGVSMSMEADSLEPVHDFVQDSESQESDLRISNTWTDRLAAWVESVPFVLRTPRQHGGSSFSTDLTPLAIEKFAPLWVQRQRLLLELMYHNLSVNLLRPFICCKLKSPATGQYVDRPSARGAAHAVALTHILYQVVDSTTILDGWHEVFQWQWNAAVTLVGFVLSQPGAEVGEATAQARNGIELATHVLEKFGKSFASASSAASIIRNLSDSLSSALKRHEAEENPRSTQRHKSASVLAVEVPEGLQTGHDLSTVDLGYFSGHEWTQDPMPGEDSTLNFDEGEVAAFMQELGHIYTPTLAVEGSSSWAASSYPRFEDGFEAFDYGRGLAGD